MIGKAHLIIQIMDDNNNESKLLIFKGPLNNLITEAKNTKPMEMEGAKYVSTKSGMKLDASLIIDDFIQLETFGSGFFDQVFPKALKEAGFRIMETSKQELEILERQIEF